MALFERENFVKSQILETHANLERNRNLILIFVNNENY